MPEPVRPKTHDPRPGMGTPEEMWKYRLAQRVKGVRLMQNKGEGWSQTYLASVCGIDKHTVQRIESGLGTTMGPIIAISRTLGISLDFLVGLDKVPRSQHEIVDAAYDSMNSLASSLEFTVSRPYQTTIQDFQDAIDMIARSRQRLVDLCFRLRHPDPKNLKLRVPYGYEFVHRMEGKLGYELDM